MDNITDIILIMQLDLSIVLGEKIGDKVEAIVNNQYVWLTDKQVSDFYLLRDSWF